MEPALLTSKPRLSGSPHAGILNSSKAELLRLCVALRNPYYIVSPIPSIADDTLQATDHCDSCRAIWSYGGSVDNPATTFSGANDMTSEYEVY